MKANLRNHFLRWAAALLVLSGMSALATVRYVDLNSPNPAPPFTDWSSAATNIQDAVDVADPGDQILVTNGVYATGGTLVSGVNASNRVAMTKVLTLKSVNGPEVTAIQGYRVPGTTNGPTAVRCVYLTNGAALIGFTLTNGATTKMLYDSGGGIWIQTDIHGSTSIVSNCVLVGNSADYAGGGVVGGGTLNNCIFSGNWARGMGGGAYGSSVVLNSCKLIGNSTGASGGGAYGGTLNNCLVVSNSSGSGGGVYSGILNNCTVTGNTAGSGGGVKNLTSMRNCIVYDNFATGVPSVSSNYWDSPMAYCCTTPSAGGITSITNAPLFVDQAGGDYHLQSNSPCINAGNNAYAVGSTDLDDNSRIVGGTVDVGAYECQSPALLDYYNWLQNYGLPTTSSSVYADADSDLMNNWQEWIAGTVPTNSLSVLRLLNPTPGASGVIVCWQSVSSRNYFLERSTDLGAQPPFLLLKTNLTGQAGTTTFTDTNAVGDGPFFYRVGVQQ